MKNIAASLSHAVQRLARFPFYPLLVGVYVVLFLWSVNIGQVVLGETLRAAAVLTGLGLVVFLVCLALVRKPHKAALISLWILAVLFMYGQIFNLVDGLSLAGVALGRHRYFLPLVGLLTIVFIYLVLRARGDFRGLTPALNLLILALIVFSVVPIVSYDLRYGAQLNSPKAAAPVTNPAPADAPDVYYFIVDGYARSDELSSVFEYDNTWFTDGLKKLGFYMPACPYSNYVTTVPSLSSSFNMDYLENMGISQKATVDDFDPALTNLIDDSAVRQEFQKMGYKLVAFRGYIPALNLRDADYYYNYEEISNRVNLVEQHIFERLLMRTSLLRPVVEDYEANPDSVSNYLPAWASNLLDMQPDMFNVSDSVQMAEQLFTFDKLPTLTDLPGKKLIYGHIYTSHFPYLIGADGSPLPQSEHYTAAGYVQAVQYTSERLLAILQEILQKSKIKPIIIVQGDHGQPDQVGILHSKILSAYYFPNGDYSRLYDTITPVNSFRVVLDQFFGRNYSLLPDTILVNDAILKRTPVVHRVQAACGVQ